MTRIWMAVGLSLLLATGPVWAQSKTGTTIGQFLKIEPGARTAGMGNAGAALSEDVEAIYFNPGAIGTLEESAFTFTHADWFAGIRFDYGAAALTVGGFGNLFASVTSLNSGEIDVRTVENPLGTGERYTVSNTALGLGYGRQITRRFAVGIQLSYVHETIWNTAMSTWTVSAGTVYRLTEGGLQMGFSLVNLGTDGRFSGRGLAIQYDDDPDEYGDNSALPGEQLTDKFPVPILFRFGLSFPYEFSENSQLLLLIDALHPNDNTECLNLGVEWTLLKILALRAGYQTLFQEDTELGLTFGSGVRLADGRLVLGYSWAEHKELGETQRITLALGF